MKRSALLRHLRQHGCALKREGASHSLWTNSANGAVEAVPRHIEIANLLAKKIREVPRRLIRGRAEGQMWQLDALQAGRAQDVVDLLGLGGQPFEPWLSQHGVQDHQALVTRKPAWRSVNERRHRDQG